jgi:hypothetical protein
MKFIGCDEDKNGLISTLSINIIHGGLQRLTELECGQRISRDIIVLICCYLAVSVVQHSGTFLNKTQEL